MIPPTKRCFLCKDVFTPKDLILDSLCSEYKKRKKTPEEKRRIYDRNKN